MALALPPIEGEEFVLRSQKIAENSETEDEDFDFEAIPFKADYEYTDSAEIRTLLENGTKVLGTPAASLTWGIDGNRAIPALTAGKEGEKQTAGLLNKLAEKYPTLFVFHSLSWPESAGDTDHICVYGDLIIVIDSKRWKGSRKYSVTQSGSILRGTVPFPSGRVHIGSALQVWRRKFPNNKVLGVVTIAQEKVYVVRDKNWYKAPYRLVEYEKLEEFLEETFTKHKTDKVNGNTLVKLGLLLVKARDRISEIVRVGGEERKGDIPQAGFVKSLED